MNNIHKEINEDSKPKAVLVGVQLKEDITQSMSELHQLVDAAGCEVVGELIQKKDRVESTYYIGKGKLEELKNACDGLDADLVIFNDELSGMQLRNIEDKLNLKVIDRTILILDIFSQRAVSKEGKLQVELAQLQYRKSRLIGIGKSLSRTGGGIGTRGPGEKKLETDRRHIVQRTMDIKKELETVKKNRQTQRLKREKTDIPIVSLVGYTNAGKSTVLNQLLHMVNKEEKSVFEKNMLFATLDTFQRNIKLDTNEEFILIDTVGFVSKLPHMLINAFKATLEEVLYADLILHIVDASSENFYFQMEVTERVLKEIGAEDKKIITVFNKMDQVNYDESIIPSGEDVLYISAKKGQGMHLLLDKIKEILFADVIKVKLLIPFEKGEVSSYLCDNTKINNMKYTEKGVFIETELSQADYNRYFQFIMEETK